ncbi:hypothetical protein HOY82DRAFT_167305 [Tuber indicum]|nr:hypothetical protein HOY82DRAFT_167305 [Tuber indicum]
MRCGERANERRGTTNSRDEARPSQRRTASMTGEFKDGQLHAQPASFVSIPTSIHGSQQKMQIMVSRASVLGQTAKARFGPWGVGLFGAVFLYSARTSCGGKNWKMTKMFFGGLTGQFSVLKPIEQPCFQHFISTFSDYYFLPRAVLVRVRYSTGTTRTRQEVLVLVQYKYSETGGRFCMGVPACREMHVHLLVGFESRRCLQIRGRWKVNFRRR